MQYKNQKRHPLHVTTFTTCGLKEVGKSVMQNQIVT